MELSADRPEYHRYPQTQKRVARLQPKEEWMSVEVPELRVVDEAICAKVKAC